MLYNIERKRMREREEVGKELRLRKFERIKLVLNLREKEKVLKAKLGKTKKDFSYRIFVLMVYCLHRLIVEHFKTVSATSNYDALKSLSLI